MKINCNIIVKINLFIINLIVDRQIWDLPMMMCHYWYSPARARSAVDGSPLKPPPRCLCLVFLRRLRLVLMWRRRLVLLWRLRLPPANEAHLDPARRLRLVLMWRLRLPPANEAHLDTPGNLLNNSPNIII